MKVFWAPLVVPGIEPDAVLSLLHVAEHSARCGFSRFEVGYNATDQARNLLTLAFLEASTSPDDVLVMLDTDHLYPADVVMKLAQHHRPVVGALYFGRKAPFEAMFFERNGSGELVKPSKWRKPGVECAMVGTAAMAIRRDVFDKLQNAGFEYPWFRYEYVDQSRHRPSEDMYFGKICEKTGIPHYVDTTLDIPHLQPIGIAREHYEFYSRQEAKQAKAGQ